jgi:hypothetical protein
MCQGLAKFGRRFLSPGTKGKETGRKYNCPSPSALRDWIRQVMDVWTKQTPNEQNRDHLVDHVQF